MEYTHPLDDPDWEIDPYDEPTHSSWVLLLAIALGVIFLSGMHYFDRWTQPPNVHMGTVTILGKHGEYIGRTLCKSSYAIADTAARTWTVYTPTGEGELVVMCASEGQ